MKWKPLLSGVLALIVLEVLVTAPAAGRVSSLFALPGSWATKLIDPTVPLLGGKGLPGGSAIAPILTLVPALPATPDLTSNPPAQNLLLKGATL